MSTPQADSREKIIYRGSLTQGDLREDLHLKEHGDIVVATRMRRRPVSTVRVVAASLLGLAGAVLLLLVASGNAPSIFLGGGVVIAVASSLAAVGTAIYALNHLFFKRRRFEAHSSIDQESLATLADLKRTRSDVTRFLLDVAFASVRLERAVSAVETARERARITDSSERLGKVAQRAEEELSQAQAMEKTMLSRLVEFVAEEEETTRGRWEKF